MRPPDPEPFVSVGRGTDIDNYCPSFLSNMDTPDSDAVTRAARTRRLLLVLGGLSMLLLTVGTSVIFAGRPGIGLGLVAASVLALIGAIMVVFLVG